EGGTVVLSAAGTTDPEQPAGQLTYQWDLNNNGIYGEVGPGATHGAETGQAVTFRATAELDGPRSYNVTLRVTDAGGLTSTLDVPITITDAPPTATFGGDAEVNEGSTASVGFTNPTDPSAADAGAGFTYSFDFNGDGGFEASGPVARVTVPASFLDD